MRRAPLVLLATLLCGVPACGGGGDAAAPAETTGPREAQSRIQPGAHDVAILEMGDLGSVRIELLPELAPKSVAEFERLAGEGFYDGTYFHRVIPGFMIQGGDPNTKNLDPRDDGRGSTGERIPDEFTDYPHSRGTVSMANTGYSNSASSQFFIVQQDTPHLDGQYTVIGRVIDGMQTVDRVSDLPIDTYGRYGPPDRPYPTNAVIDRMRIERAGSGELARTTATPENLPE